MSGLSSTTQAKNQEWESKLKGKDVNTAEVPSSLLPPLIPEVI
jgi:hypothetical protein